MRFGIVREVGAGERRVAMTPAGAATLIGEDHEVVLESRAGEGSGFTDTEYLAAGAEVVYTLRDVMAQAEVLLKVQTVSAEEIALLEPDCVVVGFLHLAASGADIFKGLVAREATTVALELLQASDGTFPVVEPLSAIGGRVALSMAAYHLSLPGGGDGTLLGGCPGVLPCHVVVIGAGMAGAAAAEEAARLGARVTLLDIDGRKLRGYGQWRGIATAIATPYNVSRCVETADVLIGAVARRGEPAPRILTRHQIRTLPPGALFVDLSIDEGGCSETSRPTSANEPVYEAEGVRHMCVPNLPALVSRTASRALGNAVMPYLRVLSEQGLEGALRADRYLARATQMYRGKVVSRRLARHQGGEALRLESLLLSAPR